MVELPLDKQPQGEREDLENDHKGTTLALAHVATFQQCARSLDLLPVFWTAPSWTFPA